MKMVEATSDHIPLVKTYFYLQISNKSTYENMSIFTSGSLGNQPAKIDFYEQFYVETAP